ncbi:hypothetical protein HYH02_006758 [Chlamydomonas schloesseri]|uniref:PhoD-like phosphatase domain-containing protein n=1 Tax=Chlamydomonas schloesseri TaxID=2026947 RepID=A0A835WJ04_9CHLO|nr:hypothetical protein HYH02_006758 [Chlamydomonas schloesseri]|eukprot:KAG2448173.1 hypothetical protein HYH02_006758 [Chlamydomonas schloesseri]
MNPPPGQQFPQYGGPAPPPAYPSVPGGPAPGAAPPPPPGAQLPAGAGSSAPAAGGAGAESTSPPPRTGFMRFFSRNKPEQGSPGQTASPGTEANQQQAEQQQQPGRTTSPGRLFGLFGRNKDNAAASQSPHDPSLPAAANAAALQQQQLQAGVTVVPPPTGMCSRLPPPPEEVAALQTSPLSPSKFGLLNRAPTTAAAQSPGTAAGAAAGHSGPAVDPNFSGPAPLEETYGPYLRFQGYTPATHLYELSVMAIIHQSKSPMPPHLRYRDMHQHRSEVVLRNPVRLWSYAGYNFWRWDLALQLGGAPATLEYCIVSSSDHFFTTHKKYHIQLPSANQKWHWGFYSCNGFHDPNDELAQGGIQPLWRDVLHVHQRDPIHVMFGGGDQLYCDDVWKLPSLVTWTVIRDRPSRNSHPFSQAMVNETFDFYFRNYTHHFGKEVFADAIATIPQCMVWDDHDIFDGWGSYPPELQNSPVFSGIFFVARKFYLLFQCHAAEDNHRQLNKGWGLTGLSWTRMVGSTTAVIGLDSRGERTRDQIIRPASWAAFQDQCAKLPAGVRHVVVLATVPTIYPSVPGVEDAMMALAGTGVMANALTAFLQKTGLSEHLFNMFGEPELLDDLLDHWSADVHEVEKFCLVRMMQDLALARGFRFTILSGDVHCAGLGMYQTYPKQNLKSDHRYMQQIISSAIGNIPPPEAVLKALCASNKPRMLDNHTREKMRGIFENGLLLKGQRNWADVHERPLLTGPAAAAATLAGGVSGGAADGSLHFQLRVEHPVYKEVRPSTYDIWVPVLELQPGSFSPAPLPVAPPLPQPLMIKFQAELVAAGVGMDAAMPVTHGAVGGAAPQLHTGHPGAQDQLAAHAAQQAAAQQAAAQVAASNQALQQQQQLQQQQAQAAAAAEQLKAMSLGAGAGAAAAAAGAGALQHAPPPAQQQDGFGLASDINQHAQQQQAQAGSYIPQVAPAGAAPYPYGSPPPAPGTAPLQPAYPSQAGAPPGQPGPYPPAQPGYPPAQPGYPPAQPAAAGGYPAQPPAASSYPPVASSYPPAAGAYPPPPNASAGGYPPAPAAAPAYPPPPGASPYAPPPAGAPSPYGPPAGAPSPYGPPTAGGYPPPPANPYAPPPAPYGPPAAGGYPPPPGAGAYPPAAGYGPL